MRGAETGINRSIFISWFVGKCSFSALKGHHHERSIKRLARKRKKGLGRNDMQGNGENAQEGTTDKGKL
jgi:hypothetical protein